MALGIASRISKLIVEIGLNALQSEKRARLGGSVYDRSKGTRDYLLTNSSAIAQQQRSYALKLSVRHAAYTHVHGDVIEFGTATGGSALLLASALAELEIEFNSPRRRLFLLDSFIGLPNPEHFLDQENVQTKAEYWAEGNYSGLSAAELRELLGNFLPQDEIITVQGFYDSTVHELPADASFSVLHVYCDYYSSTIDALGPLFDTGRISRGAIILFDDWWVDGTSSRTGERAAWQDLVDRHKIEFSDFDNYSTSGHRVVVHGYSSG